MRSESQMNKVVLDTNILISALVFGGNSEKVLNQILEGEIKAATSEILIAELTEKLLKKFTFTQERIVQIKEMLGQNFETVYPKKSINISRDLDDNRVLEAGVEGDCDFIITGDKDLLELKSYKGIKIVTVKLAS